MDDQGGGSWGDCPGCGTGVYRSHHNYSLRGGEWWHVVCWYGRNAPGAAPGFAPPACGVCRRVIEKGDHSYTLGDVPIHSACDPVGSGGVFPCASRCKMSGARCELPPGHPGQHYHGEFRWVTE